MSFQRNVENEMQWIFLLLLMSIDVVPSALILKHLYLASHKRICKQYRPGSDGVGSVSKQFALNTAITKTRLYNFDPLVKAVLRVPTIYVLSRNMKNIRVFI